MTDWCLITDIDGTLLGQQETTLELRRAMQRARERAAALGGRIRWAIATGRGIQSTREVLLESGFELTDFDALITSVGAELYLADSQSASTAYESVLRQSLFDAQAVRAAMAPLSELRPQPAHEQLPYKVSYIVSDTPLIRSKVNVALSELSFPTLCVYCLDEYLDIAPDCGAKGGAVDHLLKAWGISASRAVAAGDSGNDLTMLEREWHAIVVANGSAQLAAKLGPTQAYFAANKYAAGVLEGLQALGFLD